jgi:AcrR family transcriptional regulator
MARRYGMRARAAARDRTRDRIIRATMEVHDEKGVAPATMSEIAQRAGVGQATVSRHFPTVGDLVRACGAHVWQEMQPPIPDQAAQVFAGATTRRERLVRLVGELDGFYRRGALRLGLALRDRELIPELHQFWCAVEAGIEALVRHALSGETEDAIQVALALTSFPVWSALNGRPLPAAELPGVMVTLLETATSRPPRR